MPKSPEEMAAAMARNLPEKTGKSLEEWLPIAKAAGVDKHRALTNHLKAEHGITHGYASFIAREALSTGDEPTGDALVENQYAGPKAGLRPIYDKLVEAVSGFGGNVEIAPKKAYVSLRGKTQFGLIQPSTKTRVDVGIKLEGVEPTERLETSGSFNQMVTHRVRVNGPGDVDAQLVGWLRQAYDAS